MRLERLETEVAVRVGRQGAVKGWVLGVLAGGVLAGGGLLGAGCKEAPASTREAAEAAAEAALEEEAAPPPALTAARLGAFIRYQQLRLESDATLERRVGDAALRLELAGGPGAGAEAGAQPAAAQKASQKAARSAVAAMEARAAAEEDARTQAGLTPAEVRAFTTLVGDVLRPRLLARTLGLEETLRALEEQRGKLQGEKLAELDAQLASLRARAEALRRLPQERSRYGDAAVDLVLAREADLLRNHDAMMARLAGGGPPAP